jgi:hypothetical protein
MWRLNIFTAANTLRETAPRFCFAVVSSPVFVRRVPYVSINYYIYRSKKKRKERARAQRTDSF